jgi:predicted MFS family arabinose efflux permease
MLWHLCHNFKITMSAITSSKTQPELTAVTLWIMTIATGLVVANLYYNQPLLDDISNTFHCSKAKAGQVSMITQIGYAAGMLFLAPLADMFKRKRLMVILFAFIVLSSLLTAAAPTINILIFASFLLGASSMVPQLLVPMAAHLAKPQERGKKIGVVMSGLLIGILLSRTFSGYIGQFFGWRTVFYTAAGIMVMIWILIGLFLPEVEPDYTGSYKNLMRSLIDLVQQEPKLRMAALRGALCFACFSAFWTTIVFLLKENFDMGSAVAGEFGLVGAFGALAAGLMGRLSDKMDAYKLSGFTLSLIIISFVIFFFSAHSIPGLIAGVIILDMGVQATHISNQAIIFTLDPKARNRINTVYMVSYFIGGSLGTLLATMVWKNYQWNGVCAVGACLSVIALLVHLLSRNAMQGKPAV